MVKLKKTYPGLKVMLSLGGWGGCETCSDVFNTEKGREEFAVSVREISAYFKTDGIDLDWEYPVVKGYPGHNRRPGDRENFTSLVKKLREINGDTFLISFAAGGYTDYIDSAIAWKDADQYIDFVNIMSYDLVHGYSTRSGHHTPLHSTKQQTESLEHAVMLMVRSGMPKHKLVVGAAFYGRFFKIDEGVPVDLYQPAHFSHSFSWKHMPDSLSEKNGFRRAWDPVAGAPYAINEHRRLVATFDDEQSIALKTKYALNNELGGIMFWQLMDDKFKDGLLEVIHKNK
jgi:chitinase